MKLTVKCVSGTFKTLHDVMMLMAKCRLVCRKLRLQVKEETESEEVMLKTGRGDALDKMKSSLNDELEREEKKLRLVLHCCQ